MGGLMGSLQSLSAVDLGALTIAEALRRANVKSDKVQECIMGNVISAGLAQAPARQAALQAGIPDTVPCTTVNKVLLLFSCMSSSLFSESSFLFSCLLYPGELYATCSPLLTSLCSTPLLSSRSAAPGSRQ
jgi:hypothetical protein